MCSGKVADPVVHMLQPEIIRAGQRRVGDPGEARLVAFENLEAIPETPLQIDGLCQTIVEIEMQPILTLTLIQAVYIGKADIQCFDRFSNGIVPGSAVGRL